MSSEIRVRLKAKGQSYNNAITLLCLTTTPTRELAQAVDLVYDGGKSTLAYELEEQTEEEIAHEKEYGIYTVLTKEKLDEILAYYDKEIAQLSKQLTDTNLRIEKIEKSIPQALSVDVYNAMIETVNGLVEVAEDLKKYIEEYQYLKNEWQFSVQAVFEANSACSSIFEEFELIYYMG